ncbi:MAG TPA: type I DNA topoisomerase [bacterium]|nr:type I DNA topoisomerase [bacterium]
MASEKALVIVESPTKAKTIAKFLGKNYIVKSSFGHVRDLPEKGMGIDIANNFEPEYDITEKAKPKVADLKKALKESDIVYLATDEDREGEAIAWHLTHALNLKGKKTHRITFHEITPKAIEKSLTAPREIDLPLVDAQQARRVIDRLVGYKLSPFLWKKISYGLSAGRVQSVAVRLVVEREREIEAFKSIKYWSITADFEKSPATFQADMIKYAGEKIKKHGIDSAENADEMMRVARDEKYHVASIEEKTTKKSPFPPFTTSTLQQAANNKLNFSAKQTMQLAQKLYEGVTLGKKESIGLITYMRTDSLNLSADFISETQKYIKDTLPAEYSLDKERTFKNKSKNAQEAHEAIRPTSIYRTPESVRPYLEDRAFKLYKLIWERALATQLPEMIVNNRAVTISNQDKKIEFKANGATLKFDGFSRIYTVSVSENILPELSEKDPVDLKNIASKEHQTEPPARYTEASLIKVLEEYGIGRPSTYAPTLSTIQQRGYIIQEDKKLKPTDTAMFVNDLLVKYFPDIVDYQFTAKLEENFDEIAEGKHEWKQIVSDFYKPFEKNLLEQEKNVTDEKLEELSHEVCPECGSKLRLKKSRFGAFWGCSKYPECTYTKNNSKDAPEDNNKEPEKTGGKCPECGSDLVIKHGRFGKFIACSNYPTCKHTQPITMGIKCPECGLGEIVERKTKRGKLFYGCSNYPTCKFANWNKPYDKPCPKCDNTMFYDKKNMIKCIKCEYTMPNPEPTQTEKPMEENPGAEPEMDNNENE